MRAHRTKWKMFGCWNDRMRHVVVYEFPFSVPCHFLSGQSQCTALSLCLSVTGAACMPSPFLVHLIHRIESWMANGERINSTFLVQLPTRFTMRWKWDATTNHCINVCLLQPPHTDKHRLLSFSSFRNYMVKIGCWPNEATRQQNRFFSSAPQKQERKNTHSTRKRLHSRK